MRLFTTIAIAIGGVVAAQSDFALPTDLQLQGIVMEASAVRVDWEQDLRDDPADSLYRLARETLNNGNNRKAVDLFRELRRRYPQSEYVPDAMYWQAFALNRIGSERNLREAQSLLEDQIERFPDAASTKDSRTLLTQVRGKLAKGGNPDAAGKIADIAGKSGGCSDDDAEMRLAALQALLQMNSQEALPILKNVLARRDECSVELRRKAVFLVAQHQTSETEEILLGAARNDPDSEVREQAIFWLSNVHSERALSALDSILKSSGDDELREKAIFAIANMGADRGFEILRTFAGTPSNPEELRSKAVFWLGQHGGSNPQNIVFLRQLFDKTDSEDVQNAIIQAMSQTSSAESNRWLLDVIQNEKQSVETRKKALFWAGQRHNLELSALLPLYDRMKDEELREHFIFVLSQRREAAATDKLIQIAKSDPDKEMRKKALFWLAQKNDPRAKQLLLEIINQ
ncbi:MAG TPA: HEAT repeat domain-containing protein [Gemmatimonadaceae bacterium]|nr:HEAT repeat domain-containing protein [Gemmatimonadaceae bacterium]